MSVCRKERGHCLPNRYNRILVVFPVSCSRFRETAVSGIEYADGAGAGGEFLFHTIFLALSVVCSKDNVNYGDRVWIVHNFVKDAGMVKKARLSNSLAFFCDCLI